MDGLVRKQRAVSESHVPFQLWSCVLLCKYLYKCLPVTHSLTYSSETRTSHQLTGPVLATAGADFTRGIVESSADLTALQCGAGVAPSLAAAARAPPPCFLSMHGLRWCVSRLSPRLQKLSFINLSHHSPAQTHFSWFISFVFYKFCFH